MSNCASWIGSINETALSLTTIDLKPKGLAYTHNPVASPCIPEVAVIVFQMKYSLSPTLYTNILHMQIAAIRAQVFCEILSLNRKVCSEILFNSISVFSVTLWWI